MAPGPTSLGWISNELYSSWAPTAPDADVDAAADDVAADVALDVAEAESLSLLPPPQPDIVIAADTTNTAPAVRIAIGLTAVSL